MRENIGFIGAGNMCQALVRGWLAKAVVPSQSIFVSNRTPGKVKKLVDECHINGSSTNEELVDASQVVVLAIKPQDLVAAVEPIQSTFRADQIVISLAAGIPLKRLKKLLPQCPHLVRVMANTPAQVMHGAFGYCTLNSNPVVDRLMERLFEPLGLTVKLDEGEPFQAFSIATSAGVGFVFELMIYWQEWLEERGIDSTDAQQMTIQTFRGAAELALQSMPQSLTELQAKVTSKKGITAAGLASMRELDIERLLRYSFEKSAIRDGELSQD